MCGLGCFFATTAELSSLQERLHGLQRQKIIDYLSLYRKSLLTPVLVGPVSLRVKARVLIETYQDLWSDH